MSACTGLEKSICEYVESRRERLVGIIQGLVRIPSENMPPAGSERACQEHIAGFLRPLGCAPTLYEVDDVPGLREHPLFGGNRNYSGRPNLGARLKGSGGGRSLVLSGHIDTVPRGNARWTRDPFGGEVEGGRLYGRGSNDMKGGVGTNMFVVEALKELNIRLAGDLVFETVIDEEFGGCTGTLAGRLKGFNADAAVISEPSFLRICPAQRGGRTAHITFTAPGGILSPGAFPSGTVDQLSYFLQHLGEFAALRRAAAPEHEFYPARESAVPVAVTKVWTSPWGTSEPITVPETCKVEFYWQTMPGETQETVEAQFFEWLDRLTAQAPALFPVKPLVEFPIRWLPGSAIPAGNPLVRTLSECAAQVLGKPPALEGIEGPCDMYIFHQFGMPAVLWGARGGNTHAADEYLEIDSVVDAAKALLLFVCRWCGAA
ncbi:MAG: M20/M25/M40 family metallo-hydrolase [Acidobacteriota bacterium]